MFIKIIRFERTKQGTRGVLLVNGSLFCMTLELPWENNEQNESCIPEGVYKASKYTSKTRSIGKTIQISNVPNRSGIVFHVGNTVEDTKGCILLGDNFSKDAVAIRDSTAAMLRFRELLVKETLFTVQISEA